jgi:thiamine-monophosphate kinase
MARPGEFELIERYFRPLAGAPGALSLTDDAAVYEPPAGEEVVLKADLIAENIHFFADDPPRSIASKALRVNLSDLAAKGAVPVGYLLSLALKPDWTEAWIAGFAAGLALDQERFDVTLFGGDTSRASGGTVVSIAAIGRIPVGRIVRRNGARPGDAVFVSGTIGDAALGLRIRLGTLDAMPAGGSADHLLDRYLHPQPRIALAPVIRNHASASMDVSDGLVGDLGHICRQSRVAAEIDAAAVPLSAGARALVAADPTALETALTGGDDYEILATVAAERAEAFADAAAAAGVPVTRIGRIAAGEPRVTVLGADGPLRFGHASHVHF